MRAAPLTEVAARSLAAAMPPRLGWAGPPEGSYCPLGGGVRVPRRHCALHGWELLLAMPRLPHNEAPLPILRGVARSAGVRAAPAQIGKSHVGVAVGLKYP